MNSAVSELHPISGTTLAPACLRSDKDTVILVDLKIHHDYHDIIIKGIYPNYLKVYMKPNIDSTEDLIEFQQSKNEVIM